MRRNSFFVLLLILSLLDHVSSSFKGRLYGLSGLSDDASFVQVIDNSKTYDRLLNLGRALFSGPATAMRSINNESYVVTYHISDTLGVPHYYLLIVDVKNAPKVKTNVTISGPGYGSFWQVADDQNQIVGIRESAHAGASLELAAIDQTSGQVKTLGLYPYGSYSLVMGFARQRRLYYNIIDANQFCGINVDTGRLEISIMIPNDYAIYAIVYDSQTNRLLSLTYSDMIVKNAWFLASIDIEPSSSTMKFQRIGNSSIPMDGNHFWSTTYTLATKERQWITLWGSGTGDNNMLISFHIDTGDIIQNQVINRSKYLNNLVYFD